jgi:hypothetical protein
MMGKKVAKNISPSAREKVSRTFGKPCKEDPYAHQDSIEMGQRSRSHQ